MSKILPNTIKFNKLDGLDNVFVLDDKYLAQYFDHNKLTEKETGEKQKFNMYAKKNKDGDLIPLEEKEDFLYVAELEYSGKIKDLKPSGYEYFSGSNGVMYRKGAKFNSIWIRKAGISIVVNDLHILSGALLGWLIDSNFDINNIGSVMICEKTGNVRKKTNF